MPNDPTVTIIMSVYNGKAFVGEAIASILQQTYRDFEFIIIDDGSTDGSYEILADYATQDDRIRVLHNEKNLMLVRSLNRGLALARGRYIARQDADDISLPCRLEQQINYLEQRPDVVAISGRFHRLIQGRLHFGENIIVHGGKPALMPWHMTFAYSAQHSISVYRAGVVGAYDEARLHSEDYDLWYRLMQLGKIVVLPQVIAYVRLHETNITRLKREEVEVSARATQQDIYCWLTGWHLSNSESQDLRAFGNRHFAEIVDLKALQITVLRLQQAFVNQHPHWFLYTARFLVRHYLHWLSLAILKGNYSRAKEIIPVITQWGLWTVLLGLFDLLWMQLCPRLIFQFRPNFHSRIS